MLKLKFLDALTNSEFQSQAFHELLILLIGSAFSPVLAVILNYLSSKISKEKEFEPMKTFKETAIFAAICFPLLAFIVIIGLLIKYN